MLARTERRDRLGPVNIPPRSATTSSPTCSARPRIAPASRGLMAGNPGIGDLLADLEADDLRARLEMELLRGADRGRP
jgi:hypothetical protein